MELITYEYADLSTVHISRHDSEILHQEAINTERGSLVVLIVYEYDAGFFVHVPGEEFYDERFGYGMTALGLSEQFIRIMQQCRNQGVSILRLDRDGDCIPDDLEEFEW